MERRRNGTRMRIWHTTRRKGKIKGSNEETELREGGRGRAVAGEEEGEEEVQEKEEDGWKISNSGKELSGGLGREDLICTQYLGVFVSCRESNEAKRRMGCCKGDAWLPGQTWGSNWIP